MSVFNLSIFLSLSRHFHHDLIDCIGVFALGISLPRSLFNAGSKTRHSTSLMMTWYRCESCSGCPVRDKCCQAMNADQAMELRINKTVQELRRTSLENITTEYGIYLRQCRSIQVEGAFGLIKSDFGFRRFLTRGRKNVRTELFFLALAFDLKKLWMKRDKGRLQTHLSEISAA